MLKQFYVKEYFTNLLMLEFFLQLIIIGNWRSLGMLML